MPEREYFKAHHRIGQIIQVCEIGGEIEMEMEKEEEGPDNLDSHGSTDIGMLLSQRMLMNARI